MMGNERLSRRDRRVLERQATKLRRRAGKGFTRARLFSGGLGVIGLLGVGGVGWWLSYQSSEHPIKRQILEWDRKINKEPKFFEKIEQDLAQMVTNLFAEELGFNPNKFANKIHYFTPAEFLNWLRDNSRCITRGELDTGLIGGSNAYTGEIGLNRLRLLYEDDRNKIPRKNPASVAFCAVGHEEVHSDAEYKVIDPPQLFPANASLTLPVIGKSGFGIEFPAGPSKPGQVCGDFARKQLEEGHAHAVTLAVLEVVGLDHVFREESIDQSMIWADAYRRAIINPVFNGDYRKAQEFHRRTDDEGFFREVGLRRGVPLDQAEYQGQLYLSQILK